MEIQKQPYFKATFEVLGTDEEDVRRRIQKFIGMSAETREMMKDYKKMMEKD
jgi:hypothetical protein